MYFNVQTLSWVASKIGYKLGNWIDGIIKQLLHICDSINRETSDDQTNSIVEESLNSIECLVQRCPKEITKQIKDILRISEDLMTYDPNYNYDNAATPMEVDGWGEDEIDEWGNDDGNDYDDDSSWKVRRGAIRCTLAIVHSRPEMLKEFYQNLSVKLVERFKERDNKILVLILNTFGSLLKCSVVSVSDEQFEEEYGKGLLKRRSTVRELYAHTDFFVKELLKITPTKD